MTERDQLQCVIQWNRELARENSRLREELGRSERDRVQIGDANTALRVERDAADLLLGAALDRLLEESQR